jgi:hypothetical protein
LCFKRRGDGIEQQATEIEGEDRIDGESEFTTDGHLELQQESLQAGNCSFFVIFGAIKSIIRQKHVSYTWAANPGEIKVFCLNY